MNRMLFLKTLKFLFPPIYGLFFVLTTACLSGQRDFHLYRVQKTGAFYSRTYPFDFHSVLKASRLALKKYSLHVDDNETGVLETKILRGYNFKSRRQKRSYSSVKPFRYKIRLQLTGLNEKKAPPLTQVSIFKELIYKKDFFSEEESHFGDGLEEQVLLYRIGRELEIEKKTREKFDRNTSGDLEEDF